MLSDIPFSTTMNFDLPVDCKSAVIVASFDRIIGDQEYIITLSFATDNIFLNVDVPELSWSSKLQSTFVYVSNLALGSHYKSPAFEIPNGARKMRAHCRAWKPHGTGPEQSLTGLAVEVSMIGSTLLTNMNRIIIPGKKIIDG